MFKAQMYSKFYTREKKSGIKSIAIKIYKIRSIDHELIIYTPLESPSRVIWKKYKNFLPKLIFMEKIKKTRFLNF